MHNIQITNFEGPFELLLELVNDKKMEVSAISLASVVEEYLVTLERMKKRRDVGELTQFLEIATELLLLKSKLALPTEAEPEEEIDLEARLKEYQKFSAASKYFEKLADSGLRGFKQVKPPKFELASTFIPPAGLDMDKLLTIFKNVLNSLPEENEETEEIRFEKLNVEAKHAQIKALILSKRRLNFSDILSLSKSRLEVVVSFLAVLELLKAGVVEVLQNELFDDIVISAL